MNNPRVNRIIGYIVMFIGFYVVYKGNHTGIASNGRNSYDYITIGIGLILVIASFVWMIFKVRCPHCDGLLDIRLKNIDVCPHCGKHIG